MTMLFSPARAALLLSGLFLFPAPADAKPDPAELPGIGAPAPAFALRPFEPDAGTSTDAPTPVKLDGYCGVSAPATAAVLLFFVDEDGQADLTLATQSQLLIGLQPSQCGHACIGIKPFGMIAHQAKHGCIQRSVTHAC